MTTLPPGQAAWEAQLRVAATELARITHDYQPTGGTTADAVVEWAQRFAVEDRATVVAELATVMSATYVSRASTC